MRRSIVSALLFIPALSLAQSARTVSPGMSRSQVVAALGEPATARTASEYTYLFYANSCGKACGMNDLVILRGDSVVDAIFRSPERHYTGVSSSPEAIIAQTASKPKKKSKKAVAAHKEAKESAKTEKAEKAKAEKAASTTGPTKPITPPKEANDARPSVPSKQRPMQPAPDKSPTPTKKPT